MLSDFKDQPRRSTFYFEGIQNGRKAFLKLNIYNGTDNSDNFTNCPWFSRCGRCSCFGGGCLSRGSGRHGFVGWNIATVIWKMQVKAVRCTVQWYLVQSTISSYLPARYKKHTKSTQTSNVTTEVALFKQFTPIQVNLAHIFSHVTSVGNVTTWLPSRFLG